MVAFFFFFFLPQELLSLSWGSVGLENRKLQSELSDFSFYFSGLFFFQVQTFLILEKENNLDTKHIEQKT